MLEDTIKKFLKREIKQFDDSQDESNNALNYFRRSRIHWLYLLNILNAYYTNEVITKSDLIHKIQVSHITILKYIQETIRLGIITEEKSTKDRRKVILKPSQELILSFEEFFYEETRVLKNLFEERQQD
tara:strand:+ start:252 stop:638 length:387 start_codon:yes stop_codon:yes gene_type:complete